MRTGGAQGVGTPLSICMPQIVLQLPLLLSLMYIGLHPRNEITRLGGGELKGC